MARRSARSTGRAVLGTPPRAAGRGASRSMAPVEGVGRGSFGGSGGARRGLFAGSGRMLGGWTRLGALELALAAFRVEHQQFIRESPNTADHALENKAQEPPSMASMDFLCLELSCQTSALECNICEQKRCGTL